MPSIMLIDPTAPTLGVVTMLGARPTHLSEVSPREMLFAQLASMEGGWEPEPTEFDTAAEQEAARRALLAMSAVDESEESEQRAKNALAALQSTEALGYARALLTAQDWDFVAQANEIRGYVVSKILVHADNKDPRISLKACELAGKITEVALFTDRVDVTASRLSDSDLDKKITERLRKVAVFKERASQPVTDIELLPPADTAPTSDEPTDD